MKFIKTIGPHLVTATVGAIAAVGYISFAYGLRLDALDHDIDLIDDRAKLLVQVDTDQARRCYSASELWEDAKKNREADSVLKLQETMTG